jgi:site-specific DNA recombinase
MTVAATVPAVRRVAVYLRVSSDDQAERGTIRTQADEVHRRLEREPEVTIVGDYTDDGISGTIPLAERPGGARLVADARAGVFDEVWVYKLDRLGRDLIGLALARRSLVESGVRLVSAHEGEPDEFMFDIQSAVAANERRVFLRRSAEGMNRAAREARYCGGVVALGYRVEGKKQTARLVPDQSPMWSSLSAADVVRRIYDWIARDGWSCRRVAAELNTLGVPTACAREGTGVRARKTQSIWRAGLVRNMVTNPVYRGQLSYGRRTKKRDREVISAPIEGLVSPALWDEAQVTLARNRRCTKNTHRIYLLKGAMRCGICGLTYVGSWSKDIGWYRCGGQLVARGPLMGRCPSTAVRTDVIEPRVWAEVERFLRHPGDVLDELDGTREREAQGAIAEAESITLTRALEGLDGQRKQAIGLNIRGRLPDGELDVELDRIERERTALQARVAALQAPRAEVVAEEARDLLADVRARLDAGLSDEQRQEIVRLLVGIVVHTDVSEGRKTAKAVVTYRFPCVVPTCTGTGSSPRSAGTVTEIWPLGQPWRSPRGRPREAGAAPPMSRGRIRATRRETESRRWRG